MHKRETRKNHEPRVEKVANPIQNTCKEESQDQTPHRREAAHFYETTPFQLRNTPPTTISFLKSEVGPEFLAMGHGPWAMGHEPWAIDFKDAPYNKFMR